MASETCLVQTIKFDFLKPRFTLVPIMEKKIERLFNFSSLLRLGIYCIRQS